MNSRIKKVTDRNRIHIIKTYHTRPVSLVLQALLEQVLILTKKVKQK